jgi:excinuclease ABC subunit A
VIEHKMDVIKSADYIIDMGPDGGQLGCGGEPETIAEIRTDMRLRS